MSDVASRLNATIATVCPITGVSIGTIGNPSTVVITFAATATSAQQTSAQNALASFDWSDAAQTTWDTQQARAIAVGGLLTRNDDLGVALRAVIGDLYSEINALRVATGGAKVAQADVIARIETAIQGGLGDPSG